MLTLMVCVEAKPGKIVVSNRKLAGYYQTFGVTAKDDLEVRRLIEEYLMNDLQSELVEISERWPPDFSGSDSDIQDLVGDTDRPGIWYVSGHAWFWPDVT